MSIQEPDLVQVYKIKYSPKPPTSIDSYEIPIEQLGSKWLNFLDKTGFCKITPFHTHRNVTARAGYHKYVYIVKAKNRAMIYDSNYQYGRERYLFLAQFVDYILGRYKYKTILD